MVNTPDSLSSRFAVPGVRFDACSGDLARINISTELAQATLYTHGAHLAHWQPRGHRPVLWMSARSNYQRGKPLRGGVPIIFPWFGPRAGDPAAPLHGLVRTMEWEVQSVARQNDGSVALWLSVASDDATRAAWPGDFAVRFGVVVGATLSMTLEVTNRSPAAWSFEEGLHTYFAVGDVRQVGVEGLAGVTYIDKTDRMERKVQDAAPIRITGETDRVYLGTAAATDLTDPAWSRRIRIEKTSSSSTVVWNPWIAKAKAMPDFGDDEWPGMICVETVNAADDAVKLSPGATHRMGASISVKA
jgi:glucose-6-phosphate 1-epimerase